MIAGAWLAFACAVFSLTWSVLRGLGARRGVIGWHFQMALLASSTARDVFAVCAVAALAWHLIP